MFIATYVVIGALSALGWWTSNHYIIEPYFPDPIEKVAKKEEKKKEQAEKAAKKKAEKALETAKKRADKMVETAGKKMQAAIEKAQKSVEKAQLALLKA